MVLYILFDKVFITFPPPSVNPKELTINLLTVTHLNPLDQELLKDT